MNNQDDRQQLAERVKKACISAALEGYEHASMSGLCHEGAWEAAVCAMKMLDLELFLQDNNTE